MLTLFSAIEVQFSFIFLASSASQQEAVICGQISNGSVEGVGSVWSSGISNSSSAPGLHDGPFGFESSGLFGSVGSVVGVSVGLVSVVGGVSVVVVKVRRNKRRNTSFSGCLSLNFIG